MYTRHSIQVSRESGLSLIELMIAITISLLLLAGVIQIYLANKQTYRLQSASSYVQENGRFALEFLNQDIRETGFMGCFNSSIIPITNNLRAGGLAGFTNVNNALQGTTNPANFGATQNVVTGTDALNIFLARGCAGSDVLPGNPNNANYQIASNANCQIQQNDILIISDCQSADIHGVTNTPGGGANARITHAANLNTSPNLSKIYGPGASIYRLQSMLYYIGLNPAGNPALYRRVTGVNPDEELVEGTYNMSIQYGIDNNDSDRVANRYVPAASVGATNWGDVVSVRVSLDVRSAEDNVTPTSSTYTYNGQQITDRRLRRTFTTTIALRNRT